MAALWLILFREGQLSDDAVSSAVCKGWCLQNANCVAAITGLGHPPQLGT